jgi:CarD family transcriptional regulator
MFSLSEKVIYPGHGVAVINRIVKKTVSGLDMQFFELRFLSKDMTILVPKNNMASVGIRSLSSRESIEDIFKIMSEPFPATPQELMASNWNKRNKEYQLKLRTGNIQEICKIYRDLKHISVRKELSFGEKNLLQQTEGLLAEEISLVSDMREEMAVEHLRSFFNKDCRAVGATPSSARV